MICKSAKDFIIFAAMDMHLDDFARICELNCDSRSNANTYLIQRDAVNDYVTNSFHSIRLLLQLIWLDMVFVCLASSLVSYISVLFITKGVRSRRRSVSGNNIVTAIKQLFRIDANFRLLFSYMKWRLSI